MKSEKLLMEMLNNPNYRQIFFAIWAVIVGLFVYAMYSYYRKYTRSNFRAPGERRSTSVPKDLRYLNPNEGRGAGNGGDKGAASGNGSGGSSRRSS